MKEETLGETLGLDKDREVEIVKLVKKIIRSTLTKDKMIKRIEKQGLEKKELHFALFSAGNFAIKDDIESMLRIRETEIIAMIDPLEGLRRARAEIKEFKEFYRNVSDDERRKLIEAISGNHSVILPNGQCKCDTCDGKNRCPAEEFIRLLYKEEKKLKGEKREKSYRVKIE